MYKTKMLEVVDFFPSFCLFSSAMLLVISSEQNVFQSYVMVKMSIPTQGSNPVLLCLMSGSFPMSWFFTSGCQSIGVSASASVLPMNTLDWSPLGWSGWISLQSKGLSRVFSNTTVQKAVSFLYRPLSHPYMTPGKTIALTRQTFVGNVSAF